VGTGRSKDRKGEAKLREQGEKLRTRGEYAQEAVEEGRRRGRRTGGSQVEPESRRELGDGSGDASEREGKDNQRGAPPYHHSI